MSNDNKPIDYINKSNLADEVKKKFNEFYNYLEGFKFDENKNGKYKIGDDVILNKGTLLHGIKSYSKDKLLNIKKDGIIFSEYRGTEVLQQKFCVCFWIMNDKIKLSEYIDYYSGDTIYLKNRFCNKFDNIYIPYSSYDDRFSLFKNVNYLKYKIHFVRESKENRFMPSFSLKSKDDYVAFILNNKYTDKILDYDLYQGKIELDIIKKFIPEWAVKATVLNKLPTQTDHEISIIYGLPSSFIEGVLVGRLVESNLNYLKEIKSIFPNCYICNLDGKVIM